MITAEDIRSVTVFAGLAPEEHERLAKAAADIALQPGEYAADEGAERALFAVLEGRIEATKVREGVVRVIGQRNPGDIFGEVPVTLGTVFPVGFRAAEASRVLRLEPHDYHALAATVPEVAEEVGRLTSDRIAGAAGLQGIAAEVPEPRAVVIGDRWDPACSELRRFLDRNQITFRWIEPHAPTAPSDWGGPLPPEPDRPAIQLADGKVVVRPQHRRVAELLGQGGVYVGNDSGPSHLAAALGLGGAVLFGPTDPARWRPLSPSLAVFRATPRACRALGFDEPPVQAVVECLARGPLP